MRALAFLGFIVIIALGGLHIQYPGLAKALANEGLLIKGDDLMETKPEGYPSAVFAGGCFWCLESEFRGLNGVLFTRSGYTGGEMEYPSYNQITTGKTGHAEAVEVTYDPAQVSYEQLVEFFFMKAHDPTQLNRQGVDVGTQYRSAVYPVTDEEKATVARVIERVNMNKIYDDPIVTTIEPLQTFWEAEDYHQRYYEKYREETGRDHIRVIMKKAGK